MHKSYLERAQSGHYEFGIEDRPSKHTPKELRQLRALIVHCLHEIVALLGDRDSEVDLLGDGRTSWDEAHFRLRHALSLLEAQPAVDADCLLVKFECFRTLAEALGTQHACVVDLAFSLIPETEHVLQAGLRRQGTSSFLPDPAKVFSFPRLFSWPDSGRSSRPDVHSQGSL